MEESISFPVNVVGKSSEWSLIIATSIAFREAIKRNNAEVIIVSNRASYENALDLIGQFVLGTYDSIRRLCAENKVIVKSVPRGALKFESSATSKFIVFDDINELYSKAEYEYTEVALENIRAVKRAGINPIIVSKFRNDIDFDRRNKGWVNGKRAVTIDEINSLCKSTVITSPIGEFAASTPNNVMYLNSLPSVSFVGEIMDFKINNLEARKESGELSRLPGFYFQPDVSDHLQALTLSERVSVMKNGQGIYVADVADYTTPYEAGELKKRLDDAFIPTHKNKDKPLPAPGSVPCNLVF